MAGYGLAMKTAAMLVTVLLALVTLGACSDDDPEVEEATETTTTTSEATTTSAAEKSSDDEDPGTDNTTPSQPIIELRSRLSGDAQVGEEGDTDGTGEVEMQVDINNREICFTVSTEKITEPTGAYIARGTKDEEGQIVVPLAPPIGGNASGGARDLKAAVVTVIAGNPEAFYVNVLTEEHPEGAIRGQLALAGEG